jgi:hypothetical protein
VKEKIFVLGFFAVVAGVAAVSIYVNESIDKTERTVTAVAAPDGKYKAVRESISRGGADPFCFDTISIFLSVYPDNFAVSDRTYEVYAGPCAKPAQRADLPHIEWLSDKAVRITYPASATASDTMKMRTKLLDASKFVHLIFVAAP